MSPNCRPQDREISFDAIHNARDKRALLSFAHHAPIKSCNPHRILILFSSRFLLISRAFQLFYHTPLGFPVEQTFGSTISRYNSSFKRISISASSIASAPCHLERGVTAYRPYLYSYTSFLLGSPASVTGYRLHCFVLDSHFRFRRSISISIFLGSSAAEIACSWRPAAF